MTDADPFSEAQRQAIRKAWDMLSEHFDNVLLVVDTEVEGEGGIREDAHEGYWHGGALAAVGLAEFAKDRVMHSGRRTCDPE